MAFVSGRTDLVATAFVLLACLAVWHRREAPGQARFAAAGALAYALACLAKEVAVTLPAVLLAWEAVRARAAGVGLRSLWSRNRVWLLWFCAALLVVLYLRISVAEVGFGRFARHGGLSEAARQSSLETVPRAWVTYARLLVLPWPLLAWHRAEDLRLTPLALGCAAALLGALALTATRAHGRVGLFAGAWMLGFVLLVSGWSVIPAGSAVVAERFLYLPSLGWCGLLGHLLWASRARIGRSAAAVAVAVILLMSVGTVIRNRVWEDDLSVFRETARDIPDSWVMRTNYGTALAARGRHQEATAEFAAALELNAGYVLARQNLANSLVALGRRDEAIRNYREAIRLKPDYLEARSNLGLLLLQARRWSEAVEQYRFVLVLDPGQVQARVNLGNALSELGRNEEALDQYRAAAALEPGNALVHFNRGVTLEAMGRPLEASSAYQAALALDPGYAQARRSLAVLQARVRPR